MQKSRQKAIEAGEKRFEGNPCRVCGTTVKFTSSNSCAKCAGVRRDAYKKKKRATPRQYTKEGPLADVLKRPKLLKPWPPDTDYHPDNFNPKD